MLDKKHILNSMTKMFPKWMDIRKRVKTSKGGQLLNSIAEETANIQEAIDEYKKEFFIDSYFEKESEVIAFLYKSHIGEIDIKDLQIVNPTSTLTTSIDEFYKNKNFCYYCNGYLYFKDAEIETNHNIDKDNPKVKYAINNYVVYGELQKYHVWNVFDELASFVELKRHLWESNKSLETRILRVFEYNVNSSTDGIKNAILNEICVLQPNLKEEDIKIELPTPDNLLKYYDEFQTILDKLAYINKDVYKTKRWDMDSWSHDINSVDYIPHAWDTFIKEYKNGVGFKDDLKVLIADKNDGTPLKVSFYKERLEALREYVKDRDPKIELNLKLKKYNNKLKINNASYKITASAANDISLLDTKIKISNESTKEIHYPIEDIIDKTSDNMKDVIITDDSSLDDDAIYKVRLLPIHPYDYFKIEECCVKYIDENSNEENVSLLKESDKFKFCNDGSLQDTNTKFSTSTTENFVKSNNLENTMNGMIVNDLSKEAEAFININNVDTEKDLLSLEYDAKLAKLNKADLILKGFQKQGDNFIPQNGVDNQSIIIEGKYNRIKFKTNGNCMIKYNINGKEGSSILDGEKEFDSVNEAFKIFDKAVPMEITIKKVGKDLTVSNMEYSKYDFSFLVDNTELQLGSGVYYFPKKITDHSLKISLKSDYQYSPILKKVYVGITNTFLEYTTDQIKPISNRTRKIKIRGNVKAELIKINNGKDELANLDYKACKIYNSTSNKAYVKLDLSDYKTIKYIKPNTGEVEKIGQDYFIHLKDGNKLFSATVYGTCKSIKSNASINNIFNVKTSENDKVFVSPIIDGFVIEKKGKQFLRHLDKANLKIEQGSKVEIYNLPENYIAEFVIDSKNNNRIISSCCNGYFEELRIYQKDSQEYIAYNKENIYNKVTSNIEIVNNFSPLLPSDNKLMAYKIEPVAEKIKINFYDDKAKEAIGNWTIGKKNIIITSLSELNNSNEYSHELLDLKQKFRINDVIKLSPKYKINGQLIDLTEYMLSIEDGAEIIYRSRTKTISLKESLVKEPEYYFLEKVVCEKDMFNKLKNSNIDDIIYIGTNEWVNEFSQSDMTNSDYEVLYNEGIITWKKQSLIGKTIHILYGIRIPDYIKVDINKLYKGINYSINAYELLGEKEFSKVNDGELINVTNDYLYRNSTRILLECKNPGFSATIDKGKIKVKYTAKENEIAIKTGYYYDNGEEFYLFNNQDKTLNRINNNDYVEYHNIRREEGELVFTKGAKNFIINSLMSKDCLSETYYNNFKRDNVIDGVSKLNSLTACDNFNNWNTVGMNLKLINGINDVGILFEQKFENGYAFIDITKNLSDKNFISLYCDRAKVYIGKESKFENLNFNKSNNIELHKKLLNPYNNNFYECTFHKEEGYRYYIVVAGNGIIDDIVLTDNKNAQVENVHKKNINKLGFKIEEKHSGNYKRKIFFNSNKGAKCLGAELDKDNKIINSSHIDWGLTKIKDISLKEDYEQCEINRVDIQNNLLFSKEKGSILTDPIQINSIDTVKKLIVKINNIMFDNMKGFNVTVYGSDRMYGHYLMLTDSIKNIFSVPNIKLTPFIRLKIDMPKNKIIESIEVFAEYKSDEKNAPLAYCYGNGEFYTKILDMQSSLNCRVSDINIASISNINDVEIYIRAARENNNNQWMPWKRLEINQELKINNEIELLDCRFIQARVQLKTKNAYIKILNIDLEVM